jgi:hypothetical protein
MEITKNGLTNKISVFTNTLLHDVIGGHDFKRRELSCNIDGGTFVITVGNWSWQNSPKNGIALKSYDAGIYGKQYAACKDVQGDELCDEGLGTYQRITTTFMSAETSGGVMTITANDATKKTVSGTFDFTTLNLLDDQDSITFKGTFTDLKYIVVQ